jgi:hypothetical protein
MPEHHDVSSTSTCSNCLFDQPWWLDAVAPGAWSEVVIANGGNVVARWPYIRRNRLGLTFFSQPPYTPTLGPAILLPDGKYATQLAREKELLGGLLDELPAFHYMAQRFHNRMQNWLPFYWRGWQQTTRYTYVLDDLRDQEQTWSGLRENIRREIRKASRRLTLRTNTSIANVVAMQKKTFARQGDHPPDHDDVLKRIEAACHRRGCGRAFEAVDDAGQVHSAIYVVWDERSAYYLLGGSDPELRNSGSHSLVMWEAIRFAATVSQRFDFEGSMIEPIERFFRGFGARQVPYSKVSKSNSKLVAAALAVRQLRAA